MVVIWDGVSTFPLEESIPTEVEIEWAVKRLRNNRSGGASGMRAEHLKGWSVAARNKEKEQAAAEKDNPT